MKRLAAIAGAGLAFSALTACSPAFVYMHTVGNGQGYQVEAKQGPDDGGGALFAAAVTCSGESFWRQAPWVNVEGPANIGSTSALAGNHWASVIWCPPGKKVITPNVARSQS